MAHHPPSGGAFAQTSPVCEELFLADWSNNRLEFYDLAEVKYRKECTYRIYKKGLAKVCEEEGIKLKHHDALSDALACAELFRRHVVKGKLF